jgi:MYXO-CTERM domain-containing protein
MDRYGVGRFGDQVHVEIVVADSAVGGTGGGSATGGSGWGATSNGGNGGSSGKNHGTSVIKEEQGSGCGCRLAGERSSRTELMVALALAGLALQRRRRG